MSQPNRRKKNTKEVVAPDEGPELFEKVVHINRCAKVVKGGRRFSFAALVVVGDQEGNVGFGYGKAQMVPDAIRKGTDKAKKAMGPVSISGDTIPHPILGTYDGGKVLLRPARPGTGIIAGGPMRAVFEVLGMQDVVAKSIGSSNPYNMIHATFDALLKQGSPRLVAARRGKKVSELVSRRRDEARDDAETAEAAN